MAMELFVLSDRRLASLAEWQDSITAVAFPLRLSTDTPLQALNGFLPVLLNGRSTGFECAHWDAGRLMAECPDLDFGHRWRYALSFRFGGTDLYEGPAAFMAASAYARATDGMVLDWEQGELIAPQQAAALARDLEKDIPAMEAAMRRVVEQFRADYGSGSETGKPPHPSRRG